MAGLQKAKEYDWKDSNMALFGSDTERQVKKESAETEVAWKGAGGKVGLQIWRIVKFKVTHWNKEDYGKFYNGDSYIILNTYKEEDGDALLYDVHFWIGKHSTQDEYGTAAYKTVELDTLLDDKPIQHREVQGHESPLFRSYFKTIEILNGGADTGFRHVKPEVYEPRLLHVHGDRHGVSVKEVAKSLKALDSTDVYILDLGLRTIQWNGSGSNKNEKFTGLQHMIKLRDERGGKPKQETVDEGIGDSEFKKYLTDDDIQAEVHTGAADKTPELHRLSDESGKMTFSLEKKGQVFKSDLDSQDVFIFDVKEMLFVWIGKAASESEKKNAMTYAHNFLMKTDHALIPVTCVPENNYSKAFETALAA